MPKQFQLEGDSLPDLKARILLEFGPTARIVNAELVTVGGVWGFFARRHFQVTVQMPEGPVVGGHMVARRSAPPDVAGRAAAGPSAFPDRSAFPDPSAFPDRAEPYGRGASASSGASSASSSFPASAASASLGGLTNRPGLANLPDTSDVSDLSGLSARVERAGIAGKPGADGRAGIAALLDDADIAEARLSGTASEPRVSTGSDAFAKLMNDLAANTVADVAAADRAGQPGYAGSLSSASSSSLASSSLASSPLVPVPLTGVGDLVLVVGLADAPLAVAHSMARASGSSWVGVGGVLAGAGAGAGAGARAGAGAQVIAASERVQDRRSALAARAKGVEGGQSIFVAFGLDRAGRDVAAHASALNAISADQVWVVVDASSKSEDTAAWVDTIASIIPVDAVAAKGRAFTATPGTVDELSLPVVWLNDDTDIWPAG